MSAEPAKNASSGLLVLVILFQLFVFGLWAGGPRTNTERNCVINVQFTENIGHSVNCDSSEFVYAAAEPDNVLDTESKRQSRPGTVLLTHVLARPLVYFMKAFSDEDDKTITIRDQEKAGAVAFIVDFHKFVSAYLMYIVLHLLILVFAYKIYLHLAGVEREESEGGHLKTATALAGMTVLVNNITKQFFWSPHTQLFNLLAPVMAVYLFKRMIETRQPEIYFITVAFGCGFLMLFYGIFVLPITVAGFAFLWRRRKAMMTFGGFIMTLATGITAIAVFMAPYLLWYGFIMARNGEFYNYDVEYYGGFVWMTNMAARSDWSTVGSLWLGEFSNMLQGALMQGWGYLVLLGGLIAYMKTNMPEIRVKKAVSPLWAGALLYGVLAAIFFACYGLTVERLSFTVTAAFFPLIGFYLHRIERRTENPRAIQMAALGGVVIYIAFMLVKYGPYS